MQDLLDMKLDDIPNDPVKLFKESFNGRQIDPYDHLEVECAKNTTILVCSTDEENFARNVFAKCQANAKALIRVLGNRRLVLLTNAPFMYDYQEIQKAKREERCVAS